MAEAARQRSARRGAIGAILIVLAAVALVLAMRTSTALRVRYHAWRLDNELGGAQKLAVQALVRIGPPAVGALRRCLGSERLATRTAAADALGRIDDPEARAALAAALADPSGDVRVAAIYGLIGSADAAVLPAVRGALADRRADVRRLAVFALRAYPARIAVDELIDALGSDDPVVRDEVVARLADFDAALVLPRLFHKLKAQPHLAPRVAQLLMTALGERPGSRPEELLRWWETNRAAFAAPQASD